ncbi:hypothetical protein EVAR_44599_1 [Eumeta japonica]|uniref:Uncharacterized protein n=1 Tax=Eumeta variegata TaxID=151549 RepID=A0A4C1XCQ1_EUMVA|nr:hypothetical protein EVAR_44599_1 [Eumeta japonica]
MEMGGACGKIIRRAMDDKGDKMEWPKRKTTQRQTAQEMGGRHYRNGWTKLDAAEFLLLRSVTGSNVPVGPWFEVVFLVCRLYPSA